MMHLERIDLRDADWEALDSLPDRVLFQTREWLEFVARTQNAEPVVAALVEGGERVGCFTGLVIRRYGVRILGSPFPGWTTGSMGFNLAPGVDRSDAANALVQFAFGPVRCVHLELKDRWLSERDLAGLGFSCSSTITYLVDLSVGETDLFERMSSACRRAIRKAPCVSSMRNFAKAATGWRQRRQGSQLARAGTI